MQVDSFRQTKCNIPHVKLDVYLKVLGDGVCWTMCDHEDSISLANHAMCNFYIPSLPVNHPSSHGGHTESGIVWGIQLSANQRGLCELSGTFSVKCSIFCEDKLYNWCVTKKIRIKMLGFFLWKNTKCECIWIPNTTLVLYFHSGFLWCHYGFSKVVLPVSQSKFTTLVALTCIPPPFFGRILQHHSSTAGKLALRSLCSTS